MENLAVENKGKVIEMIPKYDLKICKSKEFCGLGKASCAVGCNGLTEKKGLLVFKKDVCKICSFNYACVSGCTHGAITL